MAAGKVRHWKHGWIPVSPEAKAYAAGHGPRPSTLPGGKQNLHLTNGDNGKAPNEKLGIPHTTGKFGDNRAGGDARAADIQELMPAVGPVSPHYQEASQSLRGRYTGGVVLRSSQVDVMLSVLEGREEGTISENATRRGGGLPLVGLTGQNPREKAESRARKLRDVLGMRSAPVPEYNPAMRTGSDTDRSEVEKAYTGGLVLLPTVADDMIERLRVNYTGQTTEMELRRYGEGTRR